MGKLLLFQPEMISAQFLLGNVFLMEELLRDVKYSNFNIFESSLKFKSGSIPLSAIFEHVNYIHYLLYIQDRVKLVI